MLLSRDELRSLFGWLGLVDFGNILISISFVATLQYYDIFTVAESSLSYWHLGHALPALLSFVYLGTLIKLPLNLNTLLALPLLVVDVVCFVFRLQYIPPSIPNVLYWGFLAMSDIAFAITALRMLHFGTASIAPPPQKVRME